MRHVLVELKTLICPLGANVSVNGVCDSPVMDC